MEKGRLFEFPWLKKRWIAVTSTIKLPYLAKVTVTRRIKLVTFCVALGLSVEFALGHAYQGVSGVIVTFFYPFFISYTYGKRVGFGTVMICHILYDFITVYTIKFMPYLIN